MLNNKKHLLFRAAMIILFLSVMVFQSTNFTLEQEQKYLDNATEQLGNDQEALTQFELMKWQRGFDQCYAVIIGVLFLVFVIRPVRRFDKWWVLFPAALVCAGIFGILMAYLDRFINPHYDISYILNFSGTYPYDSFRTLKLGGFFKMIYVLFSISTLYHLELILFRKNAPVKSIRPSFWFGAFWVFYLTILLLGLKVLNTSLLDVVKAIVPTLVMSTALTLVALFFLDSFLEDNRVSLKRSFNKFSRVLSSSLGLIGILLIPAMNDPVIDLFVDDFFVRILVFSGVIVLAVCVLTYILYRANLGQIRSTFQLKADLQQQHSELDFLKSQINPHFLFNSLNTLYGIALQEESPRTAHGIQKLSDMMRFMLRENTEEKIALNKEIDYINNYIELQSLRVARASNITLNIDIAEACKNEIAPMLLIPFIENAFKHGVSMKEASWIKVHLRCDTQSVMLEVENTRHRFTSKDFEESGIGIDNVKKRLDILYTDAYELTIDEGETTYKTVLKIWLK